MGGFAVFAYPARYRASGVMSFLVNYDGVIYENDLGKKTRERLQQPSRLSKIRGQAGSSLSQ